MYQPYWRRRLTRRRFIKIAASAAAIGGGAALLRPGIGSPPLARGAPISGVLAEDIFQGPRELARGEAVGLSWSELQAAALEPVSPEARYTSPVLKTSFPFTHLGLHWRAPSSTAEDVRFEVRTSRDGWSWSPWWSLEVEEERAPAPRGETFAHLVTEDRGRLFQYRAFLNSEAPVPPRLEYVVATALNASAKTEENGEEDSSDSAKSDLAADLPVPSEYFLSREQWGADNRLRFYGWNTAGEEIWPRRYIPTKKLIVHHTATSGNLDPRAPGYPYPNYSYDQAVSDVRAIYYYHAVTRGWGDIGYNALIDRFGRVFEGRYGRDAGGERELLSLGVEGGHVKYCNHGSDGISLIGHFEYNALGTTEEQNMVPALLNFLEWDARRHGISPSASSDFLRVDWQWLRQRPNVSGHCDWSATACPGRCVYARLQGWRETLAERFQHEELGPTVELSGPDGVAIPGNRVSFTWDAKDAEEFSYYLEGWIADVESGEVYYIDGFTGDKRPDWSSYGHATSASLGPLEQGRYTFHVRARDSQNGESTFEANKTFIVASAAPLQHTIGIPGLVKS